VTKNLRVIIVKDLKDTLRTKAFYGSICLVVFVLATLAIGLGGPIEHLLGQQPVPDENILAVQSLMGTTAFMAALLLMMLFCMYINAYAVTMEKMKRSLESLLCTPLSLKHIWLGKSLATTIPGVALGLLFAFATVAGINQFFVVPILGRFVMPGPAPTVTTLVAAPLIVFGVTSLMMALQFVISNIRWINAAVIGVMFAVTYGLSPILRFGPGSWNILLVSLGVAMAVAVLTGFLSRLVSKERIILTSKG